MKSEFDRPNTRITFLGTSSAIPDFGGDTFSLAINREVLVDTGWKVAENLRKHEIDPAGLEHLVFTHFHQDHYLSLPSLLFYILMKKKDFRGLTVIGPARDLELTIDRALAFLRQGRYIVNAGRPNIVALEPGQSYETMAFRLDTHASLHPVPGLSYRFHDKRNGVVFGISGDTAYHPPLADFFHGSRLLIHEASLGADAANPDANPALHSGAEDAARIASMAQVDRLLLTHGPRDRIGACLDAARRIFSGTVEWPEEGSTVELAGT